MSLEAIFFDRDGVINEDYGYVYKKNDLNFIEGVIDFCSFLPKNTKKFIVTNQAGIARGLYNHKQLNELMSFIFEYFEEHNIIFDDWRYCPHHPSFTGKCKCRKPEPGMLIELLDLYSIDPKNSVLIGDKLSDINAGLNSGIKANILLNMSNKKLNNSSLDIEQILIAKDFYEVKIIVNSLFKIL